MGELAPNSARDTLSAFRGTNRKIRYTEQLVVSIEHLYHRQRVNRIRVNVRRRLRNAQRRVPVEDIPTRRHIQEHNATVNRVMKITDTTESNVELNSVEDNELDESLTVVKERYPEQMRELEEAVVVVGAISNGTAEIRNPLESMGVFAITTTNINKPILVGAPGVDSTTSTSVWTRLYYDRGVQEAMANILLDASRTYESDEMLEFVDMGIVNVAGTQKTMLDIITTAMMDFIEPETADRMIEVGTIMRDNLTTDEIVAELLDDPLLGLVVDRLHVDGEGADHPHMSKTSAGRCIDRPRARFQWFVGHLSVSHALGDDVSVGHGAAENVVMKPRRVLGGQRVKGGLQCYRCRQPT
ncbi:hypothetical protein FZEAL_2669 [Fusarium zealandicum]|uniref:Uncharacterized protein n=1 Tax=Fusarium zealandicum TaxID=1053134 RepID=A0A8H4XNN2_9HYPO|nr:hypothetical protein FZEAL_2669 [Fusarium zealandicum]